MNIIRPILGALLAVSLAARVSAQADAKPNEIVAAIKKHAEICSDAQLKLDFEKFLPYVPAKLLGFMGGKEGLTKTLTQQSAEIKRRGITIDSVKIGTPDKPKELGGLLVGLVPQELVLTTPQGKLVSMSHLLAISENKGESWVFVDCMSINDEKLGILYPTLKGKIDLPPNQTKLAE